MVSLADFIDSSTILASFGKFLIMFILIAIASYIYTAIALMTIAKKTNTQNAWLAWIPIANLYLTTQIAKVPWWTIFLLLLGFIPLIGSLVVIGVVIYWWWRIAEVRNKPAWLGILVIIPIVQWIVIGVIAWSDKKLESLS